MAFERAASIARGTRWRRWLSNPFRYPAVLVFNKLIYPLWKKGIPIRTRLFTGDTFVTVLPSGTDIFLLGVKGHDAELRLTAFLLRTLRQGSVFIDVGAHFGYYSVLAARLAGSSGRIESFEAAPGSADILRTNTKEFARVSITEAAVSDHRGEISFWTFTGPQAEWNTTAVPDNYRSRSATLLRVPCIPLDEALGRIAGRDEIVVKIDVEGGEPAVLRGMSGMLTGKSLTVVLEYLADDKPENPHDRALEILQDMGYAMFAIRPAGDLMPVTDIRAYMRNAGLLSDNLVFRQFRPALT